MFSNFANSLFFRCHRAGIHPENRIERAGPQKPRCKWNNPDQKPVIFHLTGQEERRKKRDPDDDPHDPVSRSDIEFEHVLPREYLRGFLSSPYIEINAYIYPRH